MIALLLWSTDTDIGTNIGDTSTPIIILKNDIIRCNYLHSTQTSNRRRVSDMCPCPTPTHMTIFNNVIFLKYNQCRVCVCVDASYLFWLLNFNWPAELWVAIVTASVILWSIFATELHAHCPWQFQWKMWLWIWAQSTPACVTLQVSSHFIFFLVFLQCLCLVKSFKLLQLRRLLFDKQGFQWKLARKVIFSIFLSFFIWKTFRVGQTNND